ncbi:hypothetical protein LG314_10600 [Agrococcus terreus]|uniref:arsenate reductase/protein-tyrosine-phosphatase family protein n=1 Tax=Agrococcus terreus TaxID=574649 RepID=UPI00384DE786
MSHAAPTGQRGAGQAFRVLVVCSADRWRAPLAARLLARELDGVEGVEIASAGTAAEPGVPLETLAAAEAARLGVEAAGHTSRPLLPAEVERADLVIALEREHRAVAVTFAPSAARRTFTLVELARALAAVATSSDGTGPGRALGLQDAVAAAADMRGLLPPVRGPELDIPDPMRRSPVGHRRTGDAIRARVAEVAAALRALRALPGHVPPT